MYRLLIPPVVGAGFQPARPTTVGSSHTETCRYRGTRRLKAGAYKEAQIFTPCYNPRLMHEELIQQAQQKFGEHRAEQLQADIEKLAADLKAVSDYPINIENEI